MRRYTFDFSNAADGVDFQDILDGLPPVDKRIARLVIKGYTRRQIAPYVNLCERSVYYHVAKMKKIFGVHCKKR